MSSPSLPNAPRHDPFAAVRVANYRLFASGFAFSSFGLQMMSMGLAWEIYDRTQSAFMLGAVGLCRALPVIIMALPAGYAIDSFDRRRVLTLTQIGFAIGAAVMAFVSWTHGPIWITFLLITLLGCVRSFNGPVRSSLLPDLVPDSTFPNAVTWNSLLFQVSAVGGPLLAGLIISRTGEAWPVYAFTAVGCAIFSISSLGLKPLQSHAKTDITAIDPGATPVEAAPKKLSLRGMVAGMSHVWREKTILAALTLDLFAVLLGGATALLPVYAEEILKVDAVGLGWLKAAPYMGATLMAILLAWRPLKGRAGAKVLLSVAGFGVCTIVFGMSTSFWLSMAMLITLGALDGISVVARHVLVQVRTPRALRGRVSAVNSVFIESSNELGSFESGLVAHYFGPICSVVSGGVRTILVVLGVAALLPEMRKLDRVEAAPSTSDEPKAPGA